MPPPPAPKRQRRPRNVLDEDVYSASLSHIIARDFFPELLESQAQQDFLEALDSTDSDRIRDAGRRLTLVMTPGPETRRGKGTGFTPRHSVASTFADGRSRNSLAQTPGGLWTTLDGPNDSEQIKPDVDLNLSLAAFQAKYTSEDNESFNQVLDKQNENRSCDYTFFHHGNKIPSRRQLLWRAREQKTLSNGDGSGSTALTTTNAKGEERTMVASGGPSEDLDARPASVDMFPNRQGPRNHFMFGPEGVENDITTYAQAAEARSNAPPKAIQYKATRFPAVTAPPHPSVPPSPSFSAIDAAVAGRPRPTQSEPGYDGAETPRVNGYAFVDAEPTPSEMGVPIADEEAAAVERQAAMEFLPKAEDGAPNPFTVRQQSRREDLHHRLVEKADASRRKEKTGGRGGANRLDQLRHLGITPAGRTPTPKFASAPKCGGMTPAAQRLAERIAPPKRIDGMAFELKPEGPVNKTATPTPRSRRAI